MFSNQFPSRQAPLSSRFELQSFPHNASMRKWEKEERMKLVTCEQCAVIFVATYLQTFIFQSFENVLSFDIIFMSLILWEIKISFNHFGL